MASIEVRGLTRQFGGGVAVDDLSFVAQRGTDHTRHIHAGCAAPATTPQEESHMFRRLHPSAPSARTTRAVRSVSRRVTLGVLLIWVALLGATPPAAAAASSSAAPPAASAASAASAADGSSSMSSLAASSGSPRLQALLDELVAEGASGAIALVDDGTHTTRLAAGAARLDPHLPLRPDARVRVGSITKTFVATVALQLVGEGRLRLDDTVQRWLPGLVPGGAGITVRQLLNHTSGLFNYTEDPQFQQRFFANPRAYIAPAQLVAVATAHPPLFPPGAGWSYSNTNYILVGLIEEAVTGQSLGQLLDTRIVAPLHLSGTSFPARTWRIEGYHAHDYIPPALTGAGYLDFTDQNGSNSYAAGALISTADDLHRFYSALLSGRLLRPELLKEMKTTVPVSPVYGYGMGIYFLRGPCATTWGHNGGFPGYRTFAYNDVTGRRSVVVAVPTEPDPRLDALTQLTVDTAVCQMFGRVPAAGSTPGYRAPAPAPAPGADAFSLRGQQWTGRQS